MADKILELATRELSGIRNLEENMQTLKRKLKLLNSRKADVRRTLQRSELYLGKKRKREVKDWLKNVEEKTKQCKNLGQEVQQTRGYNVVSRRHLGKQVVNLIEEVEELVEQGRFSDGLLVDTLTFNTQLVTSKVKGLAFEYKLKKILSCMMDDEVLSIGIHGMGGVGKTTLAMHVHDLLLHEPKFSGRVYWATISQELNSRELQNEIARSLNLDLSSENDKKKRAARLFLALTRNDHFVLVLDDVWNDFDVEKIGIPLGMNRCKLLVTSRSADVCLKIGCQKLIKVEELSEYEARELFREKLGGGVKLAPVIDEIAHKVVKKCGGLPLGIITMARSMRGMTGIHEWKNLLEEMESCSMYVEEIENEVLPVLLCSFKWLGNPKLQRCFLYCALYPEGYKIRRDELISRFISEEVMDTRTSRRVAYDQGHSLLNKLENMCLLERYIDVSGNNCVKMHNLIRDMALWIAETNPRFMVKSGHRLVQVPEWGEDLEKVSLMENNIVYVPEGVKPPNCPNLSTLFLSWNPLLSIPDSFFAYMHGLKILDLSHTLVTKLPNSLSDLENLKALLLASCFKLKRLPCLKKLKALRELDLSYTRIEEAIEGLESLINLESLNLYAVEREVVHSRTLSNLSHLQRLILYEKRVKAKDVKGLTRLEEFQGTFHELIDFYQFIEAQRWNNYCKLWNYDIVVGQDGFFPKEPLVIGKRVSLESCDFKEIGIVLPRDIQTLRCGNCKQMECILRLSSSLSSMSEREIEYLLTLETIDLSWLPNFTCLIDFTPAASGVFSCLRELKISYCNKIKVLLPWGILDNLKNLEVLCVRSCEQMEEIIGGKSLGRNVFVALPKLRKLCLSYLPELERVSKVMVICESIQSIEIAHCEKLKKLSLMFNGQRRD